MRGMSNRPNETEQPRDKEAAVPGIAAGAPLPKGVEPGLVPVRSSAGNPLHPEKSVPGRFRKPFIPIRDVAFGGEMADKERLSFVRKIIAGRADDDTARAVFDQDMIVKIANVEFDLLWNCNLRAHKIFFRLPTCQPKLNSVLKEDPFRELRFVSEPVMPDRTTMTGQGEF